MTDIIKLGDPVQIIITMIKASDGLALDISTATTTTIFLKNNKPNLDVISKTATNVNDGTDGKMTATTTTTDIDEDGLGIWQYEGYVVIDGRPYHTQNVGSFKVVAAFGP